MTDVPNALRTRRRPKPRHGVVFDLTGAQSLSYRGRGIARYSIEMVRSLAQGFPELISAIALHSELPVPDGLDDLGPWLTTEPDFSAAAVLHMTSVFEPELPVSTFWPRQASAARLLTAVTVYDLIPDIFPGWYLADPGLRRRWRACREVVRAADAIFTLSESARQDVIALLGAPARRVTVIGSGTSPSFCPPASRAEALKLARRGARGLRKGFVLYVGAFNPRKNVDRLLQGYASMPREVVDRHQLVIV
ncbi:MAG TPA: glycosyltransferase, partial [Acidimicrobiales bacterium]|nr:glycosyltransferase [Acidimicrobiales bacterium]